MVTTIIYFTTNFFEIGHFFLFLFFEFGRNLVLLMFNGQYPTAALSRSTVGLPDAPLTSSSLPSTPELAGFPEFLPTWLGDVGSQGTDTGGAKVVTTSLRSLKLSVGQLIFCKQTPGLF